MKTVTVFFYGLFMDEDLLRSQGLTPGNGQIAEIREHDIRIGRRAYVIMEPDVSLWGVVFDLPMDQVKKLYSGPGVQDYRPVSVRALTQGGETVEAQCYNLPEGDKPRDDDRYLYMLIALCQRLDFPDIYIDRLKLL